jgi:formylglycine-generating enzyme required for sulfatase activity
LAIYWQKLGLSQLEADAIIDEVIRPYEEYNKKLEKYEKDLTDAISEAFPFSSTMESELEYYEKSLGLRDEDIKIVKDRLIAPKLVEIERLKQQQQEEQRKQEEAVRTNNLERYKQEFVKAIQSAYPLDEYVRNGLKSFQQSLGLSDKDIELIESPLISEKEADYKQKQMEVEKLKQQAERIKREQEEAERLKQQAAKAEQIKREQEEAEKLKQQAAKAEQIKRQQEEAERLRLKQVAEAERQKQEKDRLEQLRKQAEEEERLKLIQEEAALVKKQQQSKPAESEFEFEYVQIRRFVKESGGFLGFGIKTKVELDRKNGKAQYIRENLGNDVTLDLVRIPAGKFMMGISAYERKITLECYGSGSKREKAEEKLDFETPQHEVKVLSFFIGKYAVTNAQWKAVMGNLPSHNSFDYFKDDNKPVINVSWNDAKKFCKKLSEKIKMNVRLPSESEWEYACRAGTTTAFHIGKNITPEFVNYCGYMPYLDAPSGEYRCETVDVESFSPNPWGLYQMHGNVHEWCEDVMHENYNGAPTDGSAWLEEGEQNIHVIRGGKYQSGAEHCRSASRNFCNSDGFGIDTGFRVIVN